MGKRRLYDEDVQEVFGVSVAVYFEALRYRQQLHVGEFFAYGAADITRRTGLSYKQQLRAHKVLRDREWVETGRSIKNGGGTVTLFRLTDLALEVVKDTPRKRSARQIR